MLTKEFFSNQTSQIAASSLTHPRMSTTVELLACNGLPGEARLFWVNGDDEVDYGVVESGSTRVQSTFKEQRWRLRCEKPSAEVECTTSDEAEQHLLLTEASCRQKPTTRPAPQGGPLMSHHLTHPSFRRRLESRLAGAPAPASCLSDGRLGWRIRCVKMPCAVRCSLI